MERVSIFKQLLQSSKRDFSLLFSLVVILVLVFFGIIPQYIARYSYQDVNLPERLLPPSIKYPLGTDFLGRDLISLIIWGSRFALIEMIWPTVIAACIGVLLGLIAGYVGGVFDEVIMRAVDILLSFPDLLLALAILTILGPGLTNALWSVTIGRIASYIRVSRSLALPMREVGYVDYAKALGASKIRIMTRYILPNIMAPIIVQMTFSMPSSLLAVAGLSFLGLGDKPPTAEWGVLLQQSRMYLAYAPWAALVPGFIIFLVAFAFNNVGEALRDIVDPKRKYLRLI